MAKSTRTPIQAAGGIVIRNGPKPLIAVVRRRRDNAWVLPKGKLKLNETPIAAARREAIEETGSDVRVQEFLGVISYIGGSGPKIAHFWRMQAVGTGAGKLMSDIKAVDWLPLADAVERLSLPHEQEFLRTIGRMAVKRAAKRTRVRSQPPGVMLPPVHAETEDELESEANEPVAHSPARPARPSPPATDTHSAPENSGHEPRETKSRAPGRDVRHAEQDENDGQKERWPMLGRLTKRLQTAMGGR
jgi:8-oxo-dGTP diphosphatase